MPTPTRRLLLLAAGALLPALLAAWLDGLAWVAAGWILAALALAAIDFRRGASAASLRAAREVGPRLSLGVANEVHLDLFNDGDSERVVEVRDRVPEGLPAHGNTSRVVLPAQSRARLTYTVTPTTRGKYQWNCADIQVRGGWGLVQRAAVLPAETKTHVYPNIRDVGKYELLLHRRRLHLMGLRAVRKLGKGTDFDSLRDYVTDDDYRDINWKATAKAGRLITQTFRTERSQNIIIAVESGRMMTTRVGTLTKLDHAINAALLLAHVASTREDRVGLISFSSEVHTFMRPRRGRRQIAAILEALHALEPQLVEPDFGAALKALRARHKQRSLLVLFTDLLDEEASRALASHLRLLHPTYLPLVVAVSDPTVGEIAETDPLSSSDAYRAGVAAELLNERNEILEDLRKHGALVLDAVPTSLSPRVVNRYLEIKAKGVL